MHGKGMVLYNQNGNRFEGQFENGKSHDQGKLTFANGDSYIGQLSGIMPNGKGEYTNLEKNSYHGQLKNDSSNGEGTSELDKTIYSGKFENGYKNGQFIVKLPNKKKIRVTYNYDTIQEKTKSKIII